MSPATRAARHWETYVQPYPGSGGKWQISTEGGTEPVWNPNGRELFYRSGVANYAVSPDDQRFLMLKPVEQEQVAIQINVVQNWFEELKRLVPTN